MKKLLSAVTMSLLLITGGLNQAAAAEKWEFDTIHSRFYFTVDHIFSKVIGYFEEFSGNVRFNPEDLENSIFDISINSSSLNTNVRKRDNHLRSDEFFNVGKYPFITFKSNRISHKDGDNYEVEGELTIKDVTKRVVLPLTYFGTTPNPLKEGETVAGFETRLTIDRFDYHVGTGKFYKLGVTDKDIDILVSLEMLREM